MAMEDRKEVPDPIVNKKLKIDRTGNIFFLNGDLHRLVRKSAAQNICYALNFKTNTINKYTYKDYKAFKKKAYTISEVAQVLRRHVERIRHAMYTGQVKKPFLLSMEKELACITFQKKIFIPLGSILLIFIVADLE